MKIYKGCRGECERDNEDSNELGNQALYPFNRSIPIYVCLVRREPSIVCFAETVGVELANSTLLSEVRTASNFSIAHAQRKFRIEPNNSKVFHRRQLLIRQTDWKFSEGAIPHLPRTAVEQIKAINSQFLNKMGEKV